MCGLVAATNIGTGDSLNSATNINSGSLNLQVMSSIQQVERTRKLLATSMWSCTTAGATSTDPCTWTGVVCNDFGYVSEIQLNSFGLTGRIVLIPCLLSSSFTIS